MSTARKLSRRRDYREQLQRNLLTTLVLHGRVITTAAKAKHIRPAAEKMVAGAKSDKLADRRRAATYVTGDVAARRLMEMAVNTPTLTGNVRLVRTAPRQGDNAPQVAVILRQKAEVKTESKKKPEPKKATTEEAKS